MIYNMIYNNDIAYNKIIPTFIWITYKHSVFQNCVVLPWKKTDYF